MSHPKADDWDQDAIDATARGVPHPEAVVRFLGRAEVAALLSAWRTEEGWKVSPAHRTLLAAKGLADAKQPYLTVFGSRVRALLILQLEAPEGP